MSNAVKHTPLPWRFDEQPSAIYGPNGQLVCEIPQYMIARPEADAKFIVRACNAHDDLLEALKWASTAIGKYSERIKGQNESWCDGYDAMISAIAKAEGK